jgi:hypothetical protein
MARTILVAWLCLLPAGASSTSEDCFCLMNRSSGVVLRGCVAYKARTDFYETAVCTDPDTGKTSEQLITDEWQRIPAGGERCDPCQPQVQAAPAKKKPPRGNGDEGTALPPYSTRTIDEILKSLEWGNIVFNAPKKMQLKEPNMIELLLSLTKSIQELQSELNRQGELESARVRISNRMQARLSGQGFTIEALVPEEQAISGEETTRWKWQVVPTEHGLRSLHLTLSAIIPVSNRDTSFVIRTYDRTIDVEISIGQRISSFIIHNWQWLWAAVLVPIATFLWTLLRKRHRSAG